MRSGKPVQVIRNDYTSTNVTTSAWVELDAALDHEVREIEVFDSSSRVLQLALGAAGAESAVPFYIMPGGNERNPFYATRGQRLSIKAIDASATTGQLVINLYA